MNNNTIFDITVATDLVSSSDEFPVNFDDLWQWCGYSRKDSAKRTLESNFEKDFDFSLHNIVETRDDGSFSHRRDEIKLTLDAKEFAMI